MTIQGDLRCPDLFDMYIYNDYHGYGIVQVIQNTLLDFDQEKEKEKDNWKEQWAICEATILFFQSGHAMPFFMQVLSFLSILPPLSPVHTNSF